MGGSGRGSGVGMGVGMGRNRGERITISRVIVKPPIANQKRQPNFLKCKRQPDPA